MSNGRPEARNVMGDLLRLLEERPRAVRRPGMLLATARHMGYVENVEGLWTITVNGRIALGSGRYDVPKPAEPEEVPE